MQAWICKSEMAKNGGGGAEIAAALKDEGNAHYKNGNFLKAAAVYTQAIKADPSNAALYSNRSAAFLNLLKVTKALTDAETTIKLNPSWEKGYFRKGCALEGAERYDEALMVYREALEKNPQSAEVTTKIKRLTQLVRDKKRNLDKQTAKEDDSKMVTGLEQLKLDLAQGAGANVKTEVLYNFLRDIVETSLQTWNDTNGKLDSGVRFLVPIGASLATELVHVTVDKPFELDQVRSLLEIKLLPRLQGRQGCEILWPAFESPDTFHNCVFSLQEYVVETKAKAACLVVAKRSIAFPQIWKGQGSRKWKSGNSSGIFVQLESPSLRRVWFIPSLVEKGQNVCRLPELLDLDVHAILPPLFRS